MVQYIRPFHRKSIISSTIGNYYNMSILIRFPWVIGINIESREISFVSEVSEAIFDLKV